MHGHLCWRYASSNTVLSRQWSKPAGSAAYSCGYQTVGSLRRSRPLVATTFKQGFCHSSIPTASTVAGNAQAIQATQHPASISHSNELHTASTTHSDLNGGVLSYLAEQGFTAPQLEALQKSYPALSKLDVDARVKPVLEYFQQLGLNNSQVARLVGKQPRVLSYFVTDKLQPVVSWLHQQGVDKSKLCSVLETAPWLFRYSIETNLQPTLDHLVGLGLKRENIHKVFQSTIMTLTIETINAKCDVLRHTYGLPEASIQNILNSNPRILQDNLLANFNSYVAAGFTSDEIRSMATKENQVLVCNINNSTHKPKVQFYLEVAQFKIQDIAEYPRLLTSSFSTIESRWMAAVQQRPMRHPTPKEFVTLLKNKGRLL